MADEEKEITQETTEETPKESANDLQQEIEKLQTENKQLQQTVSKHAASEHKLKDQSDVLATITERLSTQEDLSATMLDYLEELKGGEVSEPTPRKTSHRDQLAEKRKVSVETPTTEISPSPDVLKFINYIDFQGLSRDDPVVLDAVKGREPEEALEYLKGKLQVKQDKTIEAKAAELAERQLKERGLTNEGASAPSASGKKRITLAELEKMSPDEYAKMQKEGKLDIGEG